MSYAVNPDRPRVGSVRGAALLVAFVVASFLPEAAGVASTLPPFSAWWTHAEHLGWSPPVWVFQAGWPLIYCALGVAGWLAWRGLPPQRSAGPLALYVTQSVLQVVWTVAFLAQGSMNGAGLWGVFTVVALLDLAVGATAIAFWSVSRAAAALMWATLAWLLFGTALSLGDTVLISLGS